VFHVVKISRKVYEFLTTRVMDDRARSFPSLWEGLDCERLRFSSLIGLRDLKLGNLPITETNINRTCFTK
jgi:hypothetical protein